MEITYIVIVGVITYIFGAVSKIFIDKMPDKFIPIQNVVIGIVSGLICYYTKIEADLLQALILCIIAAMSAGGAYDLIHTQKTKNDITIQGGNEQW